MSHALKAWGTDIDKAAAGPSPELSLARYFVECDPIYDGLGSSSVERIRAYALAALAKTNAEAGASVARETIVSSMDADGLAAAATVVARLNNPDPSYLSELVFAADRLRGRDRKVWFDRIDTAPRPYITSTATSELAIAFCAVAQHQGANLTALKPLLAVAPRPFRTAVHEILTSSKTKSCCGKRAEDPQAPTGKPIRLKSEVWHQLSEDQDGRITALGDVVLGRPSVIAFFYTRCDNPLKCSRTITQLARLSHLIANGGHNFGTFGITYDPAWDNAKRLHTFGEDRSMLFSSRSKLLRIAEGWSWVRSGFDLAVGYGPTTVNRHRIEVIVLESDGNPVFFGNGEPPAVENLLEHLMKCRR